MGAWRVRRGLTVDALGRAASASAERIDALESGRDWQDRRGELGRIAGALSLTVPDLVGSPYEPLDLWHAAIHASAYHLRRTMFEGGSQTIPVELRDPNTLLARAVDLADAEASGDEVTLAASLPSVVAALDAAAPAGSDPVKDARVQVRALASGLLRRLGWLDLSWIMLQGLRPSAPDAWSRRRLAQARLLADLGAYELAILKAQAVTAKQPGTIDARLVEADIHARSGRPAEADSALDAAHTTALDEIARHRIVAARVTVAVEAGDIGRAVDLADQVELASLPGAERVAVSVAMSGICLRQGAAARAVALILEADRVAPWRLRLDPLARELIAVLALRADARDIAALAQRVGEV